MADVRRLECRKILIFGHVTVIGFTMCCIIPNFIKVGRFLSRDVMQPSCGVCVSVTFVNSVKTIPTGTSITGASNAGKIETDRKSFFPLTAVTVSGTVSEQSVSAVTETMSKLIAHLRP